MWLPPILPPLGTWPETQACALNWEWNQRPFGSQAGTQSTGQHRPGLNVKFSVKTLFVCNGSYLQVTYSLDWRTFHIIAIGKLTPVSGHNLTGKRIYNETYFQLAKGLRFLYQIILFRVIRL